MVSLIKLNVNKGNYILSPAEVLLKTLFLLSCHEYLREQFKK
jgi:hypothetical protein|tara:strand:- start:26703 stop:26828 length:126 start_codon:yes stop_codon:yes gene_type:complete